MNLKMTFNKYIIAAFIGTVAFAFTATNHAVAQEPGEGVTVNTGVASWTSAIPVSWTFVELLSELGYDVETPTLFPSNPVAYLSIAQGDIDYWPNGWFPLHDLQLPDDWEEQGTIFEPLCPGCGVQGYLVDIESVEEYNITSLEDFRRDEVKAAFDTSGDGRADLFGCPPGWGCHEAIESALDTFELRDHINHVTAEYAINFADVLARVEAGEPTLYYTWAPSAWILALTPGEDALWINTPDILETEAERAEGIDGAVSDPINMGFIAADIQVAANNDFLADNPAAEELFRQVSLPLEWISEVDRRIVEDSLDDEAVRELVREWIADNRSTVDGWLDAARQAAM